MASSRWTWLVLLMVALGGAAVVSARHRPIAHPEAEDPPLPTVTCPQRDDLSAAETAGRVHADRMHEVIRGITPRFFNLDGGHRGAMGNLLAFAIPPKPLPELEALIADLRRLDAVAFGLAIRDFLRTLEPFPERLDADSWDARWDAEFASLHLILLAAQERRVEGRVLVEDSLQLLASGKPREQSLASAVAAVFRLPELAVPLMEQLTKREHAGYHLDTVAMLVALGTSGTPEQIPELLAYAARWNDKPAVGPAIFGILGARVGLDTYLQFGRGREDWRGLGEAGRHLLQAMRREGMTADELRGRYEDEQTVRIKRTLFHLWCQAGDDTPAGREERAASLLDLVPTLTDRNMRGSALHTVMGIGGAHHRIRAAESARTFDTRLWSNMVLNAWTLADDSDRPRVIAHVGTATADEQRTLIDMLHDWVSKERERRVNDNRTDRFAPLIEALRGTVVDEGLRRKLDEAAPK